MKNTKWCKLNEYRNIENGKQPGIYFIAYTKKNLSGLDFSLCQEIIYIGMSIAINGVVGRLNQYKKAMEGKKGYHGGAERVWFKHKNNNAFFKNAYVSVKLFPISDSKITSKDCRKKGDCVKHEYDSFADYIDLYGELPEFNDKNKSKKK